MLDPKLPEDQRAFFEKLAETQPERLRCVRVTDSEADEYDVVRRVAERQRNPVVVAASRSTLHSLNGHIRGGCVEPSPTGFRVKDVFDLFPKSPPVAHDADGMPLVPDAGIESKYRDRIKRDLERRRWDSSSRRDGDDPEDSCVRCIREADEQEVPPRFRLDRVLHEWGALPPTPDELMRVALARAAGTDRYRTRELDFVWLRENRLMALFSSPEESYLRARATEHGEVHDVTSFGPLVNALSRVCETFHPEASGGTFDLSPELEAFAAETGIALPFTLEAIRHAIAPDVKSEVSDGWSIRRGPELDARVHAVLDDILAREFILPADRASIFWRLELVRRAPLLHLRAEDARMKVVANIGAGNVLTLDISRFTAERPTPIRLIESGVGVHLDGGDVRVFAERSVDEALAASMPAAVARRRKAAAEAAASYDDDDGGDDSSGSGGWPSTTGSPSGGGRNNA